MGGGLPFPFSLQLEVTKEACSTPESWFPWAFWNFQIKTTKEGVCGDRQSCKTEKE